jgi:hypothetical protein
MHLVLVVDRPPTKVTAAEAAWLAQLQATWGHRVRVRLNDANLGASATRNRALQVCAGCVKSNAAAAANATCVCCHSQDAPSAPPPACWCWL